MLIFELPCRKKVNSSVASLEKNQTRLSLFFYNWDFLFQCRGDPILCCPDSRYRQANLLQDHRICKNAPKCLRLTSNHQVRTYAMSSGFVGKNLLYNTSGSFLCANIGQVIIMWKKCYQGEFSSKYDFQTVHFSKSDVAIKLKKTVRKTAFGTYFDRRKYSSRYDGIWIHAGQPGLHRRPQTGSSNCF